MQKRSIVAAGFVAAFLMGTAAPASAGEVTGSGKDTQGPAHARSECSFSGLNDNPDEAFPEGGRTQSFGQLVRKGVIPPQQFNPSMACNPNAPAPPPPPA